MGDVVSLREFRKKRAQKEKGLKAAENRLRHGRARDQRERERRDAERTIEQFEGKKLSGGAPGTAGDEPGPGPEAPKKPE